MHRKWLSQHIDLPLKKEDQHYLFSDGYPDKFGGLKEKIQVQATGRSGTVYCQRLTGYSKAKARAGF
jgi:hypothetical protein